MVGAHDAGGAPVQVGKSGKAQMFAAGFICMQGRSVDSRVAHRQFQQSSDPYDPVFLGHRTGTVKVEPLTPFKPGKQPTQQGGARSSSPAI